MVTVDGYKKWFRKESNPDREVLYEISHPTIERQNRSRLFAALHFRDTTIAPRYTDCTAVERTVAIAERASKNTGASFR